ARATRRPARPRSPAPASTRTASSTPSSARSNSTARSASPANGSSTPIAASAWMASRRRSMGNDPIGGGPGGGPGTLEPTPGGERDWLRFRDDPVPDEPAVSLDAFLDQTNAASVRLEAGDDV